MTTNLNITAKEESLIKFTVVFKDENGNIVTPTTLTWKLTTRSGTEIATGTVSTPSTSNVVTIYGDDLAIRSIESANKVERRILFQATYTSDLGDNLPLNWDASFMLENLVGIS